MKLNKNRVKLILSFSVIILIGSLLVGILNFNIYSKVIRNDIQNITKLTLTNIYSKIKTELIKPIFVSLTMANDEFLINWIKNDKELSLNEITSYLQGIKDKYNYSSVFFVSDVTKNYYHYGGILKKIDLKDAHDIWYFDYIKENKPYDLDVDTDEATMNSQTIFVNCQIKDENGKLLGVTGVGVIVESISDILHYFNAEHGVDTYLTDPDGVVQVHSDKSIIEKYNIFDDHEFAELRDEILSEKETLQIIEPKSKIKGNYIITRYISELDWYLVAKKSTSILAITLKKQIFNHIIFSFLIFSGVVMINANIINKSQKDLKKLATTDMLTGLYNRRSFDYRLQKAITNAMLNDIPFTLVIFDIDNFKNINDSYSHLIGDDVIKSIAQYARHCITQEAVIARWGGDEFAMIFEKRLSEVVVIMEKFRTECVNRLDISKYNVTISVGIAEYIENDKAETVLHRADKALLTAKKNGKNQIKYC